MPYGIGRRMFYAFEVGIKVHVVDLGTDGTKDIGVGIIAYHHAVGMDRAQLVHRILKNARIWLFVARGFGSHNQIKKWCESGGLHFLELAFVETIGNDVQAIVRAEVLQDLFGVGEYVWFGGSAVHKVLLQVSRYHSRFCPGMFEYQFETRLPQSFFADFPHVIQCPQLEIDRIKGLDESFGIGKSGIGQVMLDKQFGQGFLHVAVVIPQGVVQVKEEMGVFFQENLLSVGVVFDLVFGKFPVGLQYLKNLLVSDKVRVLLDKLENLLDNLLRLVQDVVENPLVHAPAAEQSGIFEIDKVSAGFGLGEIEDMLEVGDAEFLVLEQEVQDSHAGFFGQSLENPHPIVQADVFEAHLANLTKERYGK